MSKNRKEWCWNMSSSTFFLPRCSWWASRSWGPCFPQWRARSLSEQSDPLELLWSEWEGDHRVSAKTFRQVKHIQVCLHDTAWVTSISTYLQDLPPALLIKHSLSEVHLVEELGFLNLLLSDHRTCRRHIGLPGLLLRADPADRAGSWLCNSTNVSNIQKRKLG